MSFSKIQDKVIISSDFDANDREALLVAMQAIYEGSDKGKRRRIYFC